MFDAINSGNHFWYAIKRWRHRDKYRSNIQLREDSAWVLSSGKQSIILSNCRHQCARNALYALCWTQIKQIFHWVRRDLGHILVEGDNLYKSLRASDMLSVHQLPAFVTMYSHDIPVQYLRLETQLATLINGHSFLRDLLTTGGNNGITLCLLFMEGFTTAIILLRNDREYSADINRKHKEYFTSLNGSPQHIKLMC